MQRFASKPLRRSSSHITRWIEHQQVIYSTGDKLPDTPITTDPFIVTTNPPPELAFPQLTLNDQPLSRQHKKSSTDTAVLITEHDGDNKRVIEVRVVDFLRFVTRCDRSLC